MLDNMQVQAIVGPGSSEEAQIVLHLGQKAQVPIISFSATSPSLSSSNNPFFIRTAQNDTSQVKVITSMIQGFGWKEIALIHEDTIYGNGVIPYLMHAFQQIDTRIAYRLGISLSVPDTYIIDELYKLMAVQIRVFVVHMSPSLGSRFFSKVKDLGMMSEGYAWIITDGLMNQLHSLDSSIIDTMQGVLGIKPYLPPSDELHNFTIRWKRKFHRDHPEVQMPELGVFCVWAYDTARALASAVERVMGVVSPQNGKLGSGNNFRDSSSLDVSHSGAKILEAILASRFKGLVTEFIHIDQKIYTMMEFQIFNVIGKGERGIGFWNATHGFRRKLNPLSNVNYSSSTDDLEAIIWPGGSAKLPKGSVMQRSTKKLKIAVPPVITGFKELVNVAHDPQTGAAIVTGFCIDVFEAAIKELRSPFAYEYIPVGDATWRITRSYNNIIYQVHLQNFDAAVGDITITANRSLLVDFTLPYTEMGVGMIVPTNGNKKDMWIFLKPLTLDLWITGGVFFIITGFVVWVFEHRIKDELKGSVIQQFGKIFWFAFSTLVFAQREKLVSNLSRFVVIVWTFVVLILTSSYTASLSSMLTIQQLNVDLKGSSIGYQSGSPLLNFNDSNSKTLVSVDEYANSLSRGSKKGGVSAIIDEIPYIKLFLAKYDDYTMVKPPNYHVTSTNGFGFVFQKGSPWVTEISRAIAKLREEGKLDALEKMWFESKPNSTDEKSSNTLSFYSFRGLFLISGTSTALAFVIFSFLFLREHKDVLKNRIIGNYSNCTSSVLHLKHLLDKAPERIKRTNANQQQAEVEVSTDVVESSQQRSI